MVTVKEVKTKSDLRKFVDFPNELYKDNPYFVPAFFSDDMADWNHKKNPAFEYCDAKCFLAYKDGKIVGRIGAILSHKANEKFGTKRMRFSQVDFIDDYEVSKALFETVEAWALEMGCNQVHGPLGFTDMDREGMLVSGYDRMNLFYTYYNHPYYIDHLEKLGYVKDVDWKEYLIHIPGPESEQSVKLDKIARFVLRQTGYHVAEVKRRRDYKPYIRKVFELVNICYAPLYGVVELNERQVKKYADKFIPLINPDYACFVMNDRDEMVAFGVLAPSVDLAIKKSRGRLFPFGFMGVLKALKKNDRLDMFLVAVRPELQGSGINAIMLDYALKNAIKNGIRFAETGPQLEVNSKVLTQWDMFDKEQHKTRRCFIKDIG